MVLAMALLLLAPHFDGWQEGRLDDDRWYPQWPELAMPTIEIRVAGGIPGEWCPYIHWENLTDTQWEEWWDGASLIFDAHGRIALNVSLAHCIGTRCPQDGIMPWVRAGDYDRLTISPSDNYPEWFPTETQLGTWTAAGGREPLALPVEPATWGQIKARAAAQ